MDIVETVRSISNEYGLNWNNNSVLAVMQSWFDGLTLEMRKNFLDHVREIADAEASVPVD